MKKLILSVATVCLLFATLCLPSCLGTFSLTNKMLSWNRQLDSKFVNALVFFGLCVLPVYEVSVFADLLVLNTIEFWHGTNPVLAQRTRVHGSDGTEYLVISDKTGYTINNLADNTSVRLDYIPETQSWQAKLEDGSTYTLFSFVDDTHIALPADASGKTVTVEVSQAGLYAYSRMVSASNFATR